mgnify:CR=1 FL=1
MATQVIRFHKQAPKALAPVTTIKAARAIAGSLGEPSKMPGRAYGLPTRLCRAGGKLRAKTNSTCSKCYARKGRYVFRNVTDAQEKRAAGLRHPQWSEAMVLLILRANCEWFRWHDSGDLQGLWHLILIVAIARELPWINFWLPTREIGMVRQYLAQHGEFPKNLCVRISAHWVDDLIAPQAECTSVVRSKEDWILPGTWKCPAPQQNGKCGDCRACWDRSVARVSYKQH